MFGEDETTHFHIPCRDDDGQRTAIRVRAVADHHVAITLADHRPVYLPPLDVGRLRAALRSAVLRETERSPD